MSITATSNPRGVPVPINAFTDRSVYLAMVHQGISGQLVRSTVAAYDCRELLTRVLNVSTSNLSRVYARKRLAVNQSEAVLDTLRVLEKSDQTFEDQAIATQWLRTPVSALGGVAPNELLDTFEGRKMVTEVLNKIAYGDFS